MLQSVQDLLQPGYLNETIKKFGETIRDYRCNYPLFIKTCEIANGILALIPAHKKPALRVGLSHTISLLYFYQTLRSFQVYFYPINAKTISEDGLRNFLNYFVKTNFRSNLSKSILKKIQKKNLVFENENQLLNFIEHKFGKHLETEFSGNYFSERQKDQITNFQAIKHIPLAEKIGDIAWKVVNFGGAALTCLHWVNKENSYTRKLSSFVEASLYAGFAIQLFENIRKLHDEKLSVNERYALKWDSLACFAKVGVLSLRYLNNANFIHCRSVLTICDLAANVLCAFAIIKESDREFFPELIEPSMLYAR